MNKSKSPPREGELYKIYEIGEHTFPIRYGYYSDSERDSVDPLPLFPDFIKAPAFAADGRPLVTIVQPPCEHYRPQDEEHKEEWCGDCRHYSDPSAEIALCNCEQKSLK